MPLKVEIEDIFPDAMTRWARLQFVQIDLFFSQDTEAFIERAGLMRSSHHQHGFSLTLTTKCRFSAQSNKTCIVVFNGLDIARQNFQLVF